MLTNMAIIAMTIMSSIRVNPDVYFSICIKSYCHAIVTICMIAPNIAIANHITKTPARRRAAGSMYFTIFPSAISTSRLYCIEILALISLIVEVRSALSIIWMISGVKNTCSLSSVSIELEIFPPWDISSEIRRKSFSMTLFPALEPVSLSVFTILTPDFESRWNVDIVRTMR